MNFALLFLSFNVALLNAADSVESGITASHGGVVLPGQSLTLSYKAESNWTICIWYRHDSPADYQHCMFIRVRDQLVKSCSSPAFENNLEIDVYDALRCDIKILNVTEADNGKWSVRIDEQLANLNVNVTVAVKAKDISIKAGPLEAGKYGRISCHVTGSRPEPLVSHSFQRIFGVASPEINSTTIQSTDENGLFTSDNIVVVKPTPYDHNREVYCREVQEVEDEELFEPMETQTKLNVTFPPLSRRDGVGSEDRPFLFGNKVGKDLEIFISFLANPKPDSVVWEFVKNADTEETDGGESKVTVLAGTETDHYEAEDLGNATELLYESHLMIKNLEEADKDIKYRLVVNNSVGSNIYNFKVMLQEVNHTISKPSLKFAHVKQKGAGNVVAVSVTVICVIIILLVVGFFIFKIYKKRGNETAPLMSSNS